MIKKRKYLVLLFVLFTGNSFFISAQNTLIDSLQAIVINTPNDTNKVNTLIDLADAYLRNDPVQALSYSNQALQLSKKLEFKPGIAESHNMLGSGYYFRGDYLNAGNEYKQAVKLFTELRDNEGIAICYNNLGSIQSKLGYLKESQKYYLNAAKIYKETGEDYIVASLYNNIAIICERQKSLDEARGYYEKALSINRKINDSISISSNLHNIGSILYETKKYDDAEHYLQEALAIRLKVDDRSGYAITLMGLATLYQVSGNYLKALTYYKKSTIIYKELKNTVGIAECLNKSGMIYFKEKNLKQARNNFEQALKIGLEIGSLYLQKTAYDWLKDIETAEGNLSQALVYSDKYSEINDSILNTEKSNQLTKLRMEFENEKLESKRQLTFLTYKNLLQESALSRHRYIILSLTLGALLILTFSIFLLQRIKIKTQRKIIGLELDKLRQQLNPHFIFNSLNTLQASLFDEDKSASYSCLTKLSRLMRLVLENSQHKTVCIQNEIELLSLYVDLMGMRFKNKIDYKINIDKNLDTYHYEIPSLLIQPYIENSICHGLRGKEGKGKIKVEFKLINDHVRCKIEDNGIGREKAAENKMALKIEKYNSLGTKINEDRIKLLNSMYGKNLGIKFIDLKDSKNRPKGTRVEIDFPIIIN